MQTADVRICRLAFGSEREPCVIHVHNNVQTRHEKGLLKNQALFSEMADVTKRRYVMRQITPAQPAKSDNNSWNSVSVSLTSTVASRVQKRVVRIVIVDGSDPLQ